MARRKNRKLTAQTRKMLALVSQRVPMPTINDRVKLNAGVPGWGGRRGLVVETWQDHGCTYLQVRVDNTNWMLLTVLASEVKREDTLGREMAPLDTGSIWDVAKSPFAAPDARFA